MPSSKRATFDLGCRQSIAALKDPIVIIVFLTGTLISLIAADWVAAAIRQRNAELFTRFSTQFLTKIQHRLDEYAHILYGGRGLFVASESVDAAEWRAFVSSRQLGTEFPGMWGLGFSRLVKREKLPEYLAEYRLDNDPFFRLRTGTDPEMFIVTFMEPVETNSAALGFDFSSEPMRRSALEWAIRTGKPAMTRRVALVQDPEKRPAFLYLLPVYDERLGETTRLSTEKVLGLIYAAITVEGLMERVVEDVRGKIEITVRDGYPGDPESKFLYDSALPEARGKALFKQTRTFETSGRRWSVEFRALPPLFPAGDPSRHRQAFFFGLLVTALTSAIFASVRSGRARAESLVVRRTKELQAAKEIAVEAVHAKSRFLANMSHEIRSPLTAIIGFGESIREDQLEDKEAAEALNSIIRNGEHLLRVINDILDFSKIEAGGLQLELVRCSVAEIISDVANIFQPRAADRSIWFGFEYEELVPETIKSDPTRLKQILFNLIGNAIKFTSQGKVEVTISCDWMHERIRFAVKDTGIGLTEEQRGKLFKAFSQADTSTTREFGGTGLGLVISQQIAERLGGGITVESAPGNGSTFTVSVATGPLAGIQPVTNGSLDSSRTARDVDSGKTSRSGKPKISFRAKVLLAEDGIDNQRLIGHLLRKVGIEVRVTGNGKLAVDAAREEEFDLILMDMQMPVLDGYTATTLLRELGVVAPIIALTANIMPEDQQRCLAAGCSDFIGKPFKREAFLEKIGALLPENAAIILPQDCDIDQDTLPIILSFVQSLDARLENIRRAFEERDAEALKEHSHRLRAAEMFGYGALGRVAGRIENGTFDTLELETAIEELTALVSKIIAGEGDIRRQIEALGANTEGDSQ